jgi:tRNA A-37 threonylcarbamoyl transferase component Bud32
MVRAMQAVTGAGRVLAGRYRLVAPIGQGAMGTVWRAADPVLGREVAVKEIRLPGMMTATERQIRRERTLREARVAAKLSHPCVVTVHDVIEAEGNPWIVMELISARSLEAELAETGPLPAARVAAIGACLLDALASAHAVGVVHRDVKPANVLITEESRGVLTDFGIATLEGEPGLTQAGIVMGTPGFCAPERIRGEPASAASDLWSLGATLFAALEGHPPFHEQDSPMAVLARIVHSDPPTAQGAGPLAAVIRALMDRDPGRRPDAAAAGRMLAAAIRALAESPLSRRQVPALTAPAAAAAVPARVTTPVPERTGRAGTGAVPWAWPPPPGQADVPPATVPAPSSPAPAPRASRRPASDLPAHPGGSPAAASLAPTVAAHAPASGPVGMGWPVAGRIRRHWARYAAAAVAVICTGIGAGVLIAQAGKPHAAPSATGNGHHRSGAAQAPAGYRWYRAGGRPAAGLAPYTIAVPQGWEITSRGGTTTMRDPATGAAITIGPPPAGTVRPLQGIRLAMRHARNSGRFPHYRQLGALSFAVRGSVVGVSRFSYRLPGAGLMTGVAVVGHPGIPAPAVSYEFVATAPAVHWSTTRAVLAELLRTFSA